jgi:HD-GYP domain-containing protein (c-di-GMP phosphodiesterase class II)
VDLEDPIYNALYRYTKALSVALGFRDLYTRVHSERVVLISDRLGAQMGLSDQDLGILRISATFHDIGKIGVPDRILLKPGQLDGGETEEMQKHAEIGSAIVAATELEGATEAARIIRHHHECWDGSGYPDGLAGEAIPLCSRIIGVADSYDAMATRRAYHPAKSHADIMAILERETGMKHDPNVMDFFRQFSESSLRQSAALTSSPLAD